jgi:hypothetical protein
MLSEFSRAWKSPVISICAMNAVWLPCAFVSLSLACLTVRGASLIVNGEFTQSLSSWQPIGSVFDTGETAVLSDQAGARSVIFQTAVVPEGLLGLELHFDLLLSLSSTVPLGRTPDTFFGSLYFGSAHFGSIYDAGVFDSALGVLDADYRGPANTAPALVSSPSPKGPAWTHYALMLPPEEFVTVMFELTDGNGQADSVAAVDNVRLDCVFIPEPGAGILILAAASGLLRRRRSGASL